MNHTPVAYPARMTASAVSSRACTPAAARALACALSGALLAASPLGVPNGLPDGHPSIDPGDRTAEAASPRAQQAVATGAFGRPPVDHVLVVSVDGLRADLLEAPHLASFPNFARLMQGPHTLDARTDPQYTITLPNHISMVTGRPVLGPYGHGWLDNDDPPGAKEGGSIHVRKGTYLTSMFDVAHDAGLATSLATSKTKFWLFEQSYSWDSGARDTTGDDQGSSKIDLFLFGDRTVDIAGATADRLRRTTGRSLDFIHFAAPDIAGHSFDWVVKPGTPYFKSVEEVDRGLGTILDAIESDPDLRGKTAIILTSDHGGGVPRKTHTDITCPLNFRIAFLVWIGGGEPSSDLYKTCALRRLPNREDIGSRDAEVQPIRNGDAGNLALQLLGLPLIPGSYYGSLRPLGAEPAAAAGKLPSN